MNLESVLIDALRAIVTAKPAKPGDSMELNVEELNRKRDLEALRRVLQTVHWPTLDQHMQEGPYILNGRVIHFWEGFHSAINESLFSLYDKSLLAKLTKFHQLWGKTLSYDEFYNPSPNSDRYIFGSGIGTFGSSVQDAAWKTLKKP